MTTATAFKAIKAATYTSTAEFLEAVENIATVHVEHMGDAVISAMKSNFPDMETEEGPAPVFGWIDAENLIGARPAFADGFKPGTLAIIPVYGDQTAPRAEGKPLAIPTAIHFYNLPTVAQVGSLEKLRGFFNEITRAALKTSATRLAKNHEADATKHPIITDPVAALLSSMRPVRKQNAFKLMSGFARDLIVTAGKKRAEALKNAGQTAKASVVLSVFDRRQFTPDALEQALSSSAAAESLFPRLPADFWVKVLDAMIAHAPNMTKDQLVKDSDGNKVLDDDGKPLRQTVANPVSPAMFMGWKETRDETPFTTPDSMELDFSDLI